MMLRALIISFFFLSSCSPKYKNLTMGYFESTCFIQRHPGVILKLQKDKSFEYTLAYGEKKIKGTWELQGDTLFLTSYFFDKKYQQEMMPNYKYTDYSVDKDAYLLKRGKLFIIDKSQDVRRECYLNHKK
jgi:hypothetical protein